MHQLGKVISHVKKSYFSNLHMYSFCLLWP